MLRIVSKLDQPDQALRKFYISAIPAIVALNEKFNDVLGEHDLSDEVILSGQPYFDNGVWRICVVVSFTTYISPFGFLCNRIEEKLKLLALRSEIPCFLSTEYAQLPDLIRIR